MGEGSNKSNVTSFLPQGSILGPTLFTIYINDFPNCLTSQCKMIADDLKNYSKSFNHDIVQMDINNMLNRQAKHKVSKLVHSAKCKFYTERIALASSSKELRQIVNILSNRHPPKILPTI